MCCFCKTNRCCVGVALCGGKAGLPPQDVALERSRPAQSSSALGRGQASLGHGQLAVFEGEAGVNHVYENPTNRVERGAEFVGTLIDQISFPECQYQFAPQEGQPRSCAGEQEITDQRV